ncbi:MAG: type II/IV secretion system ATPase subunit [Candidatus Nezhaarchaeota archaeon]|nr:type II/IV secretion system ATPase subunit [Candidatus Nezhaarchaeota archaeon]
MRLREAFRSLFSKGKVVSTPPPVAVFSKLPEDAEVIDSYDVHPPFSRVIIASLPELGGEEAYFVEEVELLPEERAILDKLIDIMGVEVEPPEEGVDPYKHVEAEASRLARKYGLTKHLKRLGEASWPKILYYLKRDFVGFGPLHVIMSDRMIEDISVNGLNIPIYVWHRKYESMPTNVSIVDEKTLDNILVKLAHLAQRHISTAFPILDAMLPTKDRLAATFRYEVSPKGSTFCIRRFREEPFSIVDLIELGTMDEMLAAYFWLMVEHRMTVMVIGGTGAGKTTTLNVLVSLVKPSMKLVTVEEIPELMIPHSNWVQLVSRMSYGLGALKIGEISLFDLVKVSLRYRPDYIIVGEIRGEEAFVLFQAMATGHGGLTTLHAESLEHAVKRLTSPPMNIAESYIPLINVAVIQERVQLPKPRAGLTFGRRIREVYEIIDYGRYERISSWNPLTDTFIHDFTRSEMLNRIALKYGIEMESVLEELSRRALLLRDLLVRGVKKNVDVRREITRYHLLNPFPAIAIGRRAG